MSDATGLQGDCRDLFDGIAVIFDDEINDSNSVAAKLVNLLRNTQFPVVTYEKSLGNYKKLAKNLHGAAYIILDWCFCSKADQNGAEGEIPHFIAGSELSRDEECLQVSAIKDILGKTFCPIFIITQESIDEIKRVLDAAGITQGGFHSRILFCSKSALLENANRFFVIVRDWISKNAPIYVLKKWECAIRNAKKDVFQELEPHQDWPGVVWESLNQDGDDANASMLELVNTMVSSRAISYCTFAKKMMRPIDLENVENIAKIISAERYMSIGLDKKTSYPIMAGDVFKEAEGRYLINIRASCDTIRKSNPTMYVLSCFELDSMPVEYAGKDKKIVSQGGQLVRWDKSFIMPYSIESKTVEVDFSSLQVVGATDELVNKRIGRLLTPFLTRLQELYSAHMVREGLPATPKCLLKMFENA